MDLDKKNELNSHYFSLNLKEDRRKPTLLSLGFVKIQFLFDITKFSTKLLIIIFVSIFIGIYNFFLLERTGLYSLGINSVFQAIARCISYFLKKQNFENSARIFHSIIFWGMSLLLNIPAAIICYKKIGKSFATLTVVMIIVSSLTSMLLSYFPKNWGLKDFYIFSDPRSFEKCLSNDGINILQWDSTSVSTINDQSVAFNDSSKLSLIFFYGFAFGLLNTFTSMIIYAVGGSTGGIDWIVFYLTKKKKRLFPNTYLYMALTITFLSYAIGTYLPYVNHVNSDSACSVSNGAFKKSKIISNLIGPVFISTTIAAFIKKICFNLFYPHFKFIKVKIFTNKVVELRNSLLSSDFPHSFTINTAIGGYLLRDQVVFEIICFALELKNIREVVEKIDPGCLIVATPIKSIGGRFVVRDRLN